MYTYIQNNIYIQQVLVGADLVKYLKGATGVCERNRERERSRVHIYIYVYVNIYT